MAEIRLPAVDHLPSWFRQSQALLEEGKNKHKHATQKLQDLSNTTDELFNRIEVGHLFVRKEVTDGRDQNDKPEKTFSVLWHCIPSDIYGKICEFLLLHDIMNLETTSKMIRDLSKESLHWLSMTPYNVSSGDARTIMLNKAKIENKCIKFVNDMKRQRSVPRNRSIKPQRYSKLEKSVTHPMPVFENSTSEMMMSSTDTLDKDVRCQVLSALTDMSTLTSNEMDIVNDFLIAQGVVTVLISLLSNEAGAVRELAAVCLANLLHSEAIKDDRNDDMDQKRDDRSRIKEQIGACNGQKQLISLLTSPRACVNLGGRQKFGTSSRVSVQGMSSKESCRTLCNLLNPAQSIAASCTFRRRAYRIYLPQFLSPSHDNEMDYKLSLPPISDNYNMTGSSCTDTEMNIERQMDTQMPTFFLNENRWRTWEFKYFHKSGALKDVSKINIRFNSTGWILGRGSDSIGYYTICGKPELDISGWAWKLDKTYTGIDTEASTWLCESGSEFNDVEGSNHLNEELFGRSRSHVSHIAYWSDGYNLEENTLMNTKHEYGIMNTLAGEGVSRRESCDESNHHLMGWTCDICTCLNETKARNCIMCRSSGPAFNEAPTSTSSSSSRQMQTQIQESSARIGFFGIWETTSNDQHFELQKGGVFRAIPLFNYTS